MTKVLLSLPDNIIQDLDTYCSKLNYERSEFIRMIIREVIYPKDIQDVHDKLKIIPFKTVINEKKDISDLKTGNKPVEVNTVSQNIDPALIDTKEEETGNVSKDIQEISIPIKHNNLKCQINIPFPCNKPSIGKFRFVTYAEGEERKLEKELCGFHKNKIMKESGNLEEIL